MSESILGFASNAAITILSGAIVGYVIGKTMFKRMENYVAEQKAELKTELQAWLNSETGQKALYSIGGLIAAGAKGGLMTQTPRGKGGFQGMIIDLIGQFIGNKIGINPAQAVTNNTQEQPKW
jgi:hypothetical protein